MCFNPFRIISRALTPPAVRMPPAAAAPPLPPPPPAPMQPAAPAAPAIAQAAGDAGEAARAVARLNRGRMATLLTGGAGDTSAALIARPVAQGRTLLG
jgi:hypothetical protein